jgi:hypothetical protein
LDLNMSGTDIPVIDFGQISRSPNAVAQELLQACVDWGSPPARQISSAVEANLAKASSMSRTIQLLSLT